MRKKPQGSDAVLTRTRVSRWAKPAQRTLLILMLLPGGNTEPVQGFAVRLAKGQSVQLAGFRLMVEQIALRRCLQAAQCLLDQPSFVLLGVFNNEIRLGSARLFVDQNQNGALVLGSHRVLLTRIFLEKCRRADVWAEFPMARLVFLR